MRYIIFIFLLSTNFVLYSQNEVPLLPADTFLIYGALKNAEKYKEQGDRKEESRCYDQIGFIYWEHNYFKKSVEFYKKSRILNEELGNRSGISMIDHNLGMIYADLRKYDHSLIHFNKALNYRKTKKNKNGIITVLINMCVVLNNLGQYEESIKKLNEALTLSRELNDMEQMKSCYGMLSETYEKAKQSDKAYYYFTLYRTFHEKLQEDKVIRIKKTVKEKELQLQLSEVEKRNSELELRLANKEIKQKNLNISELDSTNKSLYTNLTQAELQKKLLEKDAQIKDNNLKTEIALKEKKQLQIKYLWFSIALIFIILIVIAGLYRQKNRLNKLIKQRNKELETLSIAARETDNSIMISDSKGNIEWVNYRYSKTNGISLFEICEGNKNIYNIEKDNNGLIAIKNTVEKCESHIYDREVTLHNNKAWIQTTVTPILDDDTKKIKRLVFIDSDISILKKSEQRINIQKLKIEKQSNSLQSSINYASLIQQAMLMKGNQLDNLFENSFVIYMPRDVVSGDFYWSTKVNEYIVVVEGDCTGHGVPGAFMSMIGISLLNQIVDSESIVMPNLILERLNQGIRFSLNQENNRNQDGMDASICTIDTKNKILYFSSANQVMIYFKNNEMHAIKGDRRFIGGTFINKKKKEFTLHEIKIDSEICFYLFSDGYQDQFGGTANNKVGIKKLREIITDNHKINLEQQKQNFIDYINNWRNNSQQIDDITMLGIKINDQT